MIYNDVDAEHLGGGVILFRDAVSFDVDFVTSFAEEQISKERAEMYTPTTDPETGEPAYANRSGYIFDAVGVNEMPRRGSQIHRTDREDVRNFLDFIEQSKDKYLLKYFLKFPLAYKNVWWKVKGHLVSYSTEYGGKFLGSHSDTSADWAYGFPEPKDQLATRNTLTSVVYLNDDFEGGHHYFNYLDINYVPNTGDILMFPANYMAAHEVTPVTRGSRYSYLGWYSHGTPNEAVNENVVDPAKQPDLSSIATNVYMPTLRQDFKDYMDKIGVSEQSQAYLLVKTIHS